MSQGSSCGRVLTTSEGVNLGLATIDESRLFLWSREASSDRDAGWKQIKVIDLEDALSVRALEASPQVVGFADGIGIILVRMVDAFFTVDVKSKLVKKIAEGLDFFNVVPYLSFYTPALVAASSDGGTKSNCTTWRCS